MFAWRDFKCHHPYIESSNSRECNNMKYVSILLALKRFEVELVSFFYYSVNYSTINEADYSTPYALAIVLLNEYDFKQVCDRNLLLWAQSTSD